MLIIFDNNCIFKNVNFKAEFYTMNEAEFKENTSFLKSVLKKI